MALLGATFPKVESEVLDNPAGCSDVQQVGGIGPLDNPSTEKWHAGDGLVNDDSATIKMRDRDILDEMDGILLVGYRFVLRVQIDRLFLHYIGSGNAPRLEKLLESAED